MIRRVLIATDGSENALKSVEYVANLYGGNSDLEVTLLHIHPAIPPIYQEEQQDPQVRKQFAAWREKTEDEAKRCMDEASKVLLKSGLKGAQIVAKHRPIAVGVARDIVWEADAEGYDAIVIGKKGLGRIEEFFLGSITNKLLDLCVNHPIWVVEGNVTSRKVLIAIDETDHTVELARYAGKMLSGLQGIEFLLYHCCAPFSMVLTEEEIEDLDRIGQRYAERKRERMSHFFYDAEKVLIDSGIDKKAISTRFHFERALADKRVSKSILSDVQKEKFGTVVMGRKGSTRAREYRLGTVSQRTLSEAENCALWIL